MGNLCCTRRKERRNIVLLLLGLDNAGKTVAVKNLAGESVDTVVPTVGFSVITLKHAMYDVRVFDLGGRTDFRDIWDRYYVDAYGVIFVVDSSDYERLSEAQDVLTNILSHEKIKGKPVLLLANKQDNENALDEIDLIEKLQVEALVNDCKCPTLVESCSAKEVTSKSKKPDPGIHKGYSWIINHIIREYDELSERVDADVEQQEALDRAEREEKIQRLKELCQKQEKTITNGFPQSEIFIIKSSNKSNHTDSDSCESSESIPIYYGTLEQEQRERPKSATNIIRQHLELDVLNRRPSFKFPSNKTAPAHLFGVKPAPLSAGERSLNKTTPSRRNLRSAGDSVFVVANSTKLSLPPNNGSGDMRVFEMRNVLPPINDTAKRMRHEDSTMSNHF